MQLLALRGIILAALAVVLLAWWIERATRRPGLAFGIGGILMIFGAILGFVNGNRLLPILMVVQAISFLYLAHWRSTRARSDGSRAPRA